MAARCQSKWLHFFGILLSRQRAFHFLSCTVTTVYLFFHLHRPLFGTQSLGRECRHSSRAAPPSSFALLIAHWIRSSFSCTPLPNPCGFLHQFSFPSISLRSAMGRPFPIPLTDSSPQFCIFVQFIQSFRLKKANRLIHIKRCAGSRSRE